jgi:hypothetical protein
VKIEINSASVPPHVVLYRVIGFGKPLTDQTPLPCTVSMDRAEFLRRLGPAYDEYVYECEAEDIRAGKPNAPAVIVKHRYLPLSRMLTEYPDALGDVVQRMFIQELLAALFDENQDADCRYVLNDIQSFRVTLNDVIIQGNAWEPKSKDQPPPAP